MCSEERVDRRSSLACSVQSEATCLCMYKYSIDLTLGPRRNDTGGSGMGVGGRGAGAGEGAAEEEGSSRRLGLNERILGGEEGHRRWAW